MSDEIFETNNDKRPYLNSELPPGTPQSSDTTQQISWADNLQYCNKNFKPEDESASSQNEEKHSNDETFSFIDQIISEMTSEEIDFIIDSQRFDYSDKTEGNLQPVSTDLPCSNLPYNLQYCNKKFKPEDESASSQNEEKHSNDETFSFIDQIISEMTNEEIDFIIDSQRFDYSDKTEGNLQPVSTDLPCSDEQNIIAKSAHSNSNVSHCNLLKPANASEVLENSNVTYLPKLLQEYHGNSIHQDELLPIINKLEGMELNTAVEDNKEGVKDNVTESDANFLIDDDPDIWNNMSDDESLWSDDDSVYSMYETDDDSVYSMYETDDDSDLEWEMGNLNLDNADEPVVEHSFVSLIHREYETNCRGI